MTRRIWTILAFGLALAPVAAAAQNSGTEAEQEACTPDVFRLCQDQIPNEAPIVACLQAKRAQLSPACSVVMFPPPKARTTTHLAKRRSHHRVPRELAQRQ